MHGVLFSKAASKYSKRLDQCSVKGKNILKHLLNAVKVKISDEPSKYSNN